MRDGVEIFLKGKAGSGKTAILHILGATFRDSGFNVMAVDEGNKVSDFQPKPPTLPDDRLISISTVIY